MPIKQIKGISRKNSCLSVLAVIFVVTSCGWARSVYSLYSDCGMPGDNFYTWGDWANGASIGDSNQCPGGNPEGFQCMKTTCPAGAGYCGYGIFFNSPGIDLSAYASGNVRFWVYSTTADAKIEIEDWDGDNSIVWLKNCGWTEAANKKAWTLVNIPVSSFTAVNPNLTLSKIKYPFKFTLDHPNNYAYTDHIRWTEGISLNTVYTSLALNTGASSTPVSSMTWVPVYPSTWNAANTYMKIEYDPGVLNWRIRLYTDNTGPGADPKYGGPLSDASGLVCSTSPVSAETPLRMSWTIEDTTKTVTELSKGTPGSWVNNGFAYKWLRDKSSGVLDTTDLGYVSVWTNQGVLYADWDNGTASTRAWKNSPNYLYLGADFTCVIPGRKYKTNRMMLELYYD